MTNRIVQTVIIIDSAMGNSELISPGTGNFRTYHVNAVALISNDSTATVNLTGASTADVLVHLDYTDNLVHFSQPQRFDTLKCPVVTAGTGLVYLA